MTVTAEALDAFLAACVEKTNAFNRNGYNVNVEPTQFTAERGKRYIRIVMSQYGNRSAFCFVDAETGAILKTAGWESPAKGVCGNIANGAADVGPFGVAYLR